MVVSGWSVNGGMRNYDVVTDLVAERVEQAKDTRRSGCCWRLRTQDF